MLHGENKSRKSVCIYLFVLELVQPGAGDREIEIGADSVSHCFLGTSSLTESGNARSKENDTHVMS